MTTQTPPGPGTEVPRTRHHHRLAMVVLAVVAVLVVGVAVFVHRVQPAEPGVFYDPPANLAAAKPGDVLRSESFTPALPNTSGWKVLYRSTDPWGNPIAVSGVVLAPNGANNGGGPRPVVSWAHPTTGIARRCAPSLLDDPTSGMFGAREAVANGWVWVATDYPGLGTPGPHPYLIGQSEARAVIDIVRAAGALPTGAGTTYATWGHSQGGQASVWAGMIANEYAPDLELIGVSAAAPAIQLDTLVTADENTFAGRYLLSLGLVSWSELYPDADLDVALQRPARPLARSIAKDCVETKNQSLVVAPKVEAALRLPFAAVDLTTTEPWAGILASNAADGPIDVPIFVGQGLDDKIVRPWSTRDALATRCEDGETVEFVTYPDVGHIEAGDVTSPDAMAWIAGLLGGKAAPSNCDDLPAVPAQGS